jgi:hypothetical protein
LNGIQNPGYIPSETDIKECVYVDRFFEISKIFFKVEDFNVELGFIEKYNYYEMNWNKKYGVLFYVISFEDFKDELKIKTHQEELRRIRNLPCFKNTVIVNVFRNKDKFMKEIQRNCPNYPNSEEISFENYFKNLFLVDELSSNIVEEFGGKFNSGEEIMELLKKYFKKIENFFDFKFIENYPNPKHFKVLMLGAGEVGKSTIFKKAKLRFHPSKKFNENEITQCFIMNNHLGVRNAMEILGYHKNESFLSKFPILTPIMNSDFSGSTKEMEYLGKDEELINFLKKDKSFCELFEFHHLNCLSDCHPYLFENYSQINRRLERGDATFDDYLRVYRSTLGFQSEEIFYKGNKISLFDTGKDFCLNLKEVESTKEKNGHRFLKVLIQSFLLQHYLNSMN